VREGRHSSRLPRPISPSIRYPLIRAGGVQSVRIEQVPIQAFNCGDSDRPSNRERQSAQAGR
jgi:hypothetical protein